MRVLITGATGFVGKEIVSELSGQDFEILRLKSDREKTPEQNTDMNQPIFAADISDYANLSKLEKLRNIDVLIHSAGLAHQFGDIDERRFASVNVEGTKNVAKLGIRLNIRHFILISSTAVYGIKKNLSNNKIIIDESTECLPETPYAQSKLEAEKACIQILEKHSVPLTIFRLAPVVGEDSAGNMERLTAAIDKGRFIWVGRGENLKSLIYKRDVARACLTALREKKAGTEIFNLAADPVSMKQIVDEITLRLNKSIPNIHIPAKAVKLVFQANRSLFGLNKINKIEKTIEKWLCDDIFSARKFAKANNFAPETAVLDGIARQTESYKERTRR